MTAELPNRDGAISHYKRNCSATVWKVKSCQPWAPGPGLGARPAGTAALGSDRAPGACGVLSRLPHPHASGHPADGAAAGVARHGPVDGHDRGPLAGRRQDETGLRVAGKPSGCT